jgi:hypothetical protein
LFSCRQWRQSQETKLWYSSHFLKMAISKENFDRFVIWSKERIYSWTFLLTTRAFSWLIPPMQELGINYRQRTQILQWDAAIVKASVHPVTLLDVFGCCTRACVFSWTLSA